MEQCALVAFIFHYCIICLNVNNKKQINFNMARLKFDLNLASKNATETHSLNQLMIRHWI